VPGGGLSSLAGNPRLQNASCGAVPSHPEPRVRILAVDPPDGAERDAQRIVMQMGPSVTSCYRKDLDVEPGQSGRLVLELHASSEGVVTTVRLVDSAGLSKRIVSCVEAIAKRTKFPAGASLPSLHLKMDFTPP
jgi:hypothetical protein